MGELAGVAEVHRVRRALDHRDRQVRRRQAAELLYPPPRRHERVTGADHGERGHGRPQDALERGKSHELAEQLQGVDRAEVQIVGEHHGSHARALAPHVARELHECPGERLVVHPARGRGEHDPSHAVACAMCDLQAHRPAHRVADQDHALEIERVENLEERPCQRRESQNVIPGRALSIARQIGDQRRRTVGERRGGGKQVAAGDREAVHVDDRDRAGDPRTPADEDRTPPDLDPELLPTHLGHDPVSQTRAQASQEAVKLASLNLASARSPGCSRWARSWSSCWSVRPPSAACSTRGRRPGRRGRGSPGRP